jgi:hypothetical protein
LHELNQGHFFKWETEYEATVVIEEVSCASSERLNIKLRGQCAMVLDGNSRLVKSAHGLLLAEFFAGLLGDEIPVVHEPGLLTATVSPFGGQLKKELYGVVKGQ